MRARESNDTNSIEWITRDPLPRRSPQLKELKVDTKKEKEEKGEALGVVRNKEGLRQSMRIRKLQDELGALVKQSQNLEEIDEELGITADIALEQELGEEAWCVVGEEPELKS